jgi:hypothetical protein
MRVYDNIQHKYVATCVRFSGTEALRKSEQLFDRNEESEYYNIITLQVEEVNLCCQVMEFQGTLVKWARSLRIGKDIHGELKPVSFWKPIMWTVRK